MTRQIDEFGFMRTDLSNITKEQVRPYMGHEIAGIAKEAKIAVEPDKKYYLYCPAKALKESVDLWNGMQLKLEHYVGSTIDVDREHWVGSVYDAEFAAPYLRACLTINDAEAQDLVEQGLYEELSASYMFDLINKQGSFDGINYDFEMSNIRPNHVAIVPNGRAGKACCVADENKIKEGTKTMEILDKLLAFIQGLKEVDSGTETVADEPIAGDDPAVNTEPEPELEPEPEPKPAEDEDNTDAIIAAVAGVDSALAEKLKAALGAGPAQGGAAEDEPLASPFEEDDKKPAMDAALIEKNMTKKFKNLVIAAKKVKCVVGDIDPFAYDNHEDIYALALRTKGYDTKKYPRSAWQGMAEVVVSDSIAKIRTPEVQTTAYNKDIFPHLAKKGN